MKKIIIILLSITPLFGKSQLYSDLSLGIGTKYNLPIANIYLGYNYKNFIGEYGFTTNITNAVRKDTYMPFKLGYLYKNLVWTVGYYINYKSGQSLEEKKNAMGYGLKYYYPIGNINNAYILFNALYLDKNFLFSIGSHIIIN